MEHTNATTTDPRAESIALVKAMIAAGWKPCGETPEHVAERYGYNVEFFRGILEAVKRW